MKMMMRALVMHLAAVAATADYVLALALALVPLLSLDVKVIDMHLCLRTRNKQNDN